MVDARPACRGVGPSVPAGPCYLLISYRRFIKLHQGEVGWKPCRPKCGIVIGIAGRSGSRSAAYRFELELEHPTGFGAFVVREGRVVKVIGEDEE